MRSFCSLTGLPPQSVLQNHNEGVHVENDDLRTNSDTPDHEPAESVAPVTGPQSNHSQSPQNEDENRTKAFVRSEKLWNNMRRMADSAYKQYKEFNVMSKLRGELRDVTESLKMLRAFRRQITSSMTICAQDKRILKTAVKHFKMKADFLQYELSRWEDRYWASCWASKCRARMMTQTGRNQAFYDADTRAEFLKSESERRELRLKQLLVLENHAAQISKVHKLRKANKKLWLRCQVLEYDNYIYNADVSELEDFNARQEMEISRQETEISRRERQIDELKGTQEELKERIKELENSQLEKGEGAKDK